MSISRKIINGSVEALGIGSGSGNVDDLFSTYVYKGTYVDLTIENGIDLAGEGGMVWIKSRTDTGNHSVFDTERGVHNWLRPNLSAE